MHVIDVCAKITFLYLITEPGVTKEEYVPKYRSIGIQCTLSEEQDTEQRVLDKLNKLTLPKPKRTPISNFVLRSEKRAKYYTGLDKKSCIALWNFLGDCKSNLTVIGRNGVKTGDLTCMSLECQFLMTLMILRRNYDFSEIRYMFNLSFTSVTSVFRTWLMCLYFKFRDKDVQKKM